MEQLRKLKAMLDEGLITQHDYDVTKQQVLSSFTQSTPQHSEVVDKRASPQRIGIQSSSGKVPLRSGHAPPPPPKRTQPTPPPRRPGILPRVGMINVNEDQSKGFSETVQRKTINAVDSNGFDIQIEVFETNDKSPQRKENVKRAPRVPEGRQIDYYFDSPSRTRHTAENTKSQRRKTDGDESGRVRRAPLGRFDKIGDSKRTVRESKSTFQANNFGYIKGRNVNYSVLFIPGEFSEDAKIKNTSFEILVNESGKRWKIFRLFHQFQDFDRLLKKKKMIARGFKELPPSARGKEEGKVQFLDARQRGLDSYLNKLIMYPNVAESQYLYNFLGPFQIGDEKPVSSRAI